MVMTCPECGAAVPEGGRCRDNFHALLLLESAIPGDPGGLAHFYAVASYGLQHPGSMNYTAEAAAGLRASVADVLDGRASVAHILRRTRRAGGRTHPCHKEGRRFERGLASWALADDRGRRADGGSCGVPREGG